MCSDHGNCAWLRWMTIAHEIDHDWQKMDPDFWGGTKQWTTIGEGGITIAFLLHHGPHHQCFFCMKAHTTTDLDHECRGVDQDWRQIDHDCVKMDHWFANGGSPFFLSQMRTYMCAALRKWCLSPMAIPAHVHGSTPSKKLASRATAVSTQAQVHRGVLRATLLQASAHRPGPSSCHRLHANLVETVSSGSCLTNPCSAQARYCES